MTDEGLSRIDIRELVITGYLEYESVEEPNSERGQRLKSYVERLRAIGPTHWPFLEVEETSHSLLQLLITLDTVARVTGSSFENIDPRWPSARRHELEQLPSGEYRWRTRETTFSVMVPTGVSGTANVGDGVVIDLRELRSEQEQVS